MTHTPKREVRHMCFTFDIVLGENVYQQHICYKCASDRHDFLDELLTWKVSTQVTSGKRQITHSCLILLSCLNFKNKEDKQNKCDFLLILDLNFIR